MRIDVITIFPDWFKGPFAESLLGKGQEAGLLELQVHDLRDWTHDRHRTVDDTPYGGGAGMVMRADIWFDALESVWNDVPPSTVLADDAIRVGDAQRPRTIVVTPRGRPLDQELATELAAETHLVICCGRYEGIDERVHSHGATDEVSIGDYVLAGGEVAAAVIVEAVTRLVPGVMGNKASGEDESFSDGLLEYPHYTRPLELRSLAVPDVLRSGNHAVIDAWRHEQAEELTRTRRPDLWQQRR
ncbi:MAG: tRNA (guanine37-N1)-methyltransferase [Glaciecola sp.]|jgi:tRNA (guanine37-N1)-methyltransferase